MTALTTKAHKGAAWIRAGVGPTPAPAEPKHYARAPLPWPRLGVLDRAPVVFTCGRAFVWQEGEWRGANLFEVHAEARLLGEAEFADRFGHLPPHPALPKQPN